MSFYTGRYVHSYGASSNNFSLKVGELTLGGNLGRTTMRTDTIRRYDVDTNKLTVDFALHNHNDGPASSWAKETKAGEHLSIAGPGAVKLINNNADWFFLVGGMTALHALACNLEQLPENAVIEITSEQNKQQVQQRVATIQS